MYLRWICNEGFALKLPPEGYYPSGLPFFMPDINKPLNRRKFVDLAAFFYSNINMGSGDISPARGLGARRHLNPSEIPHHTNLSSCIFGKTAYNTVKRLSRTPTNGKWQYALHAALRSAFRSGGSVFFALEYRRTVCRIRCAALYAKSREIAAFALISRLS